MLGTLSDDIRHDDSYLISIIESDAPQSQIKFDCIFALQGVLPPADRTKRKMNLSSVFATMRMVRP